MLKLNRVLIWCLLACVFMTRADAQAVASTDSGYELLNSFFKGLQTLQTDFVQTVQDSRDNVTATSSGKLLLKKPGKFRWDYAKPDAQLIVSDGKRIWLYDPELQQVTIRRADLSLQGTPAILLSGEGNIRDSFEVEHVEQRNDPIKGTTVINLTPKRSDGDFKRVQLALNKDQLVAMSLTDKLGQTTLLQFRHFKRNATVADSAFTFSAPKGVDVVDNTATGGKETR